MTKPLLWLAVGLTLIAAGWLWVAPRVFRAEWQILAGEPRVIGDSLDPFVYAGGEAVRPVVGSATVRLSADGSAGTVRLSIESAEPAPPLTLRDGSVVGRSWGLVSSVDESAEVWLDALVHGSTGLGERRLPETMAQVAGRSRFDLTVDRDRRLAGLSGFWAVADAVRQDDGSIRQQGLVFSPLLREKTGFSDPDRLELTLLLYEDGPGGNVLVHLMFSNVTVERAPAASKDNGAR